MNDEDQTAFMLAGMALLVVVVIAALLVGGYFLLEFLTRASWL